MYCSDAVTVSYQGNLTWRSLRQTSLPPTSWEIDSVYVQFFVLHEKVHLDVLGRMKKWGGGYSGQHNKTISVGVVWYGISLRRKSSSEPSSSSSPVLRKWNTVLTCRTSRQTKFLRTENFVLHKVLRLKRGGYPLQDRVTQSQYVSMSGIIMVRLSTYDGIEPNLMFFTSDGLVSPFVYHVPFLPWRSLRLRWKRKRLLQKV